MEKLVQTPQAEVEKAKWTVRYFENMKKANEEIQKLVEFNLAEAKKQLAHAESVVAGNPNQLSIEDQVKTNVPQKTKIRDGKVQKIA